MTMMAVAIRLGGAVATAVGCLWLAAACASQRDATAPPADACDITLDPDLFGATIVAVQGFAFRPAQVEVTAGSKVAWLNCEPTGTPSHTTTADGGSWDSPLLAPGDVYSFTFDTPGTYDYHCTPHPGMTAQVAVVP